jgi:branched-chain amino acid transport system permease protein
MNDFLQQLINGIMLGSIYALIALGYTMVYGVVRLINFAHGDVYMFGAFMGYYLAPLVQNKLAKLPFFSSLLAGSSILGAVIVMLGSMTLCALLGVIVERFGYRPGRDRVRFILPFWLGLLGLVIGYFVNPSTAGLVAGAAVGIVVGLIVEPFTLKSFRRASRLALLIIAIMISLLLENGGQKVFGADPKFFPQIIPYHAFNLGSVSTSNQQILVLLLSVVLMILLNVIVNYTKTGKAMRAVAFNLDAAKLMGINTDRIIAFTFALGSALAAAGGILVSLNYPKIDPLMGLMAGLKAFVAAVLGGIGNIPGAVIGGFVIGLAEVMAVGYGQSTYRDAVSFSLLILILLFKPAGILGKGLVEKV